MMGVQQALAWDRDDSFVENVTRILGNGLKGYLLRRAIPLGAELYLGLRPAKPAIRHPHPLLEGYARRLSDMVQRHAHYFKMASKWNREEIVKRQVVQARLADNAITLFALSAAVSKMDSQIRGGEYGLAFERDKSALAHAFDLFEATFYRNIGELRQNADESMRRAAEAARRYNDSLPNGDFYIPESSPVAAGTGKPVPSEGIKQFPGVASEGEGDGAMGRASAEVHSSTNRRRRM
jgi:hypothetical protein